MNGFLRHLTVHVFAFCMVLVSMLAGCDNHLAGLKIKVDVTVVKVGGSIKYGVAEGRPQDSVAWDFGDSTARINATGGLHTYTNKGKFLLALFSGGKLADSTWITVTDSVSFQDLPVINGPDKGVTGQKLNFSDAKAGQTQTIWNFGESGKIDATGDNVTYTYLHPGKFTISAVHDGKTAQAIKTIMIADTARHAAMNVTDETLLAALNDLSNPKNTPKDFKKVHERLKGYVCNNESIDVMVNNGAKKITFSAYCNRLNMLNPKILSVKATRGPDGCVTGLAVAEGQ